MTANVGPISPQLTAGIAADAAGLTDKAREHFETALDQSLSVPIRCLQPAVRYWYGRSIVSRPHPEVERGWAMVAEARADFQSLGMVPHVRLAERFLRGEDR